MAGAVKRSKSGELEKRKRSGKKNRAWDKIRSGARDGGIKAAVIRSRRQGSKIQGRSEENRNVMNLKVNEGCVKNRRGARYAQQS